LTLKYSFLKIEEENQFQSFLWTFLSCIQKLCLNLLFCLNYRHFLESDHWKINEVFRIIRLFHHFNYREFSIQHAVKQVNPKVFRFLHFLHTKGVMQFHNFDPKKFFNHHFWSFSYFYFRSFKHFHRPSFDFS